MSRRNTLSTFAKLSENKYRTFYEQPRGLPVGGRVRKIMDRQGEEWGKKICEKAHAKKMEKHSDKTRGAIQSRDINHTSHNVYFATLYIDYRSGWLTPFNRGVLSISVFLAWFMLLCLVLRALLKAPSSRLLLAGKCCGIY